MNIIKYEVWQLPVEEFIKYTLPWVTDTPPKGQYKRVYNGSLSVSLEENAEEILEKIFRILNDNHPDDYKVRSLSISDVVCLFDKDNTPSWWRVKDIGFEKMDW